MFVVLIRTLVLYILLVAGIRLLGKRQLGELEPSELTLALIIADLASVPMQDNGIPLLAGVIPIAVLLAIASILSILSTKSSPSLSRVQPHAQFWPETTAAPNSLST